MIRLKILTVSIKFPYTHSLDYCLRFFRVIGLDYVELFILYLSSLATICEISVFGCVGAQQVPLISSRC